MAGRTHPMSCFDAKAVAIANNRGGCFAVTIFLSAFLLFQVQPLIGRYVLPWFGGTPAVWTCCMLIFQAMLLGGYAYAHLISIRLSDRGQGLLHLK